MIMTHDGLPLAWAIVIVFGMLLLSFWVIVKKAPVTGGQSKGFTRSLTKIPYLGWFFSYLSQNTWPLLLLKVAFAFVFIIIITAGFWGTPIVERNLATTLTWNLWWTGIVIAIFYG